MPVPGGGALSGHTSAANIWDIPKRNEAFNGNIHLEMWDVRLPYLILLHGVCIYIYIIICIYFMVKGSNWPLVYAYMCIYTHLLVLVSKRVRLFDFWFCRSTGIIRQVAAMSYAHAGDLIWRWVKTYTSCLLWPRPISTQTTVYHDTVVSAQDLVTNSSSKIHEKKKYIYQNQWFLTSQCLLGKPPL